MNLNVRSRRSNQVVAWMVVCFFPAGFLLLACRHADGSNPWRVVRRYAAPSARTSLDAGVCGAS